MTVSLSSDRSPGRPRRDDLMSRTAIVPVFACLSTMPAQAAYAVPVMIGAQASGGGPLATFDRGVTDTCTVGTSSDPVTAGSGSEEIWRRNRARE